MELVNIPKTIAPESKIQIKSFLKKSTILFIASIIKYHHSQLPWKFI